MKRSRTAHILLVAIGLGLAVLTLSTSTGQNRRTYEVETQVYGIPVSPSDTTRAIIAYERLMERHMDLTERMATSADADSRALRDHLKAIERHLARLDVRLARIERHFGIAPAGRPMAPVDPNAPGVPAPSHRLAPLPPGLP